MFTATRDSEAKLVETIASIRDEAAHWRGAVFEFSKLLEGYRNDYQVKIAVNLVNDLLKIHQGGIFVCQDATIYVVCRNVTKAQLDKVIFQLRYLFMDDPLAYNADGQENPDFCRIYDLGNEWEKFHENARRRLAKNPRQPEIIDGPAEPRRPAKAAAAEPKVDISPRTGATTKQPKPAAPESAKADDWETTLATPRAKVEAKFNPRTLASLETDLRNADISRVLRRQPICAAMPNMPVRRVFDETYINIAHLRKMLRSDADLLSNRWLFRYLTQILDERVLDMLRYNPRAIETPISLNFNVDTLLSQAFAKFDAGLKPSAKISIVIELQISDVFADMPAFVLARDTAQKLGYRICLDGLTNLSFTNIDRERLGFDLVKLQWSPEMDTDITPREKRLLSESVQRFGSNRVILCRCDNQAAVDFGQSLGISLFQGRHLDKIINPTSRIEN